MSVSGVVTSVSPDWRGSALAAATLATDTVLSVVDAADFDEDGGWLVVADVDTPVEYLTVDEDADTITLAAAIGTAYEADEPVVVWDPTVEGGGARVREDIAEVMLPDAEQPVFAVVKHEQIPTAGVYSLVGATVVLEDEDGDDETADWYVLSVLGREANVDPDRVATPFFRAYLGANKTIPNNTDTILDGWVVTDNTGFVNPAPGYRTIYREGLYLIAGGQRWATAPTNRKAAGPSVLRANGTTETLWRDGRPNTGAVEESTAFAVPIRLYPGDQVYVVAWQNTGANLDVLGASGARLDMSFFSITWQGS